MQGQGKPRFWEAPVELVVDSGFLYLPLLFDPAIEREVLKSPKPGEIQKVQGRYFVKTIALKSLIQNFETIYPDYYLQLEADCLQALRDKSGAGEILWDDKLNIIIFQVMPHFLKREGKLHRQRFSEKDILDLLAANISVPPPYYEKAEEFLRWDPLKERLEGLKHQGLAGTHLPEGLTSGRELRQWLFQAVRHKILDREGERLGQVLKERTSLLPRPRQHLPLLLYLAGKGALELDGFGFFRTGPHDYLIYKRTGEYALKDFYGRVYLFPDCRVAVATIGPLKPVVLEKYKHPFLHRHAPGQAVCLGNYRPTKEFTAANVIRALEEGLNALYHSYSSRHRRGYHRLGPIRRQDTPVDFDDYRIPPDDPRLTSGAVEITNDYT